MSADTQPLPRWSPAARFWIYLTVAPLGAVIGALVGAFLAAIWLLWEHETLLSFHQLSPANRFLFTALIISTAYPPLALLTLAFLRSVDRKSLQDVGLTREGWSRHLFAGILTGIGFLLCLFGTYAVTGLVRFVLEDEVSWKRWLVMSLWLCPLIGFTEELVFRGYLLLVAEEWRGRKFAVALTSVLFWMAHLGQGNVHEPVGILATLCLSVTFAMARYLTGSLWFPVGLHTAYNWVALSFGGELGLGFPTLFRFELRAPAWLVGPPGHVGLLDTFAYMWLLAALLFAFRKRLSAL